MQESNRVAVIPVDQLKFCRERGVLMDLLNDAAGNYATLTNELIAKMGILPEKEYMRLRDVVDKARLDAEQARKTLIAHRADHGC